MLYEILVCLGMDFHGTFHTKDVNAFLIVFHGGGGGMKIYNAALMSNTHLVVP